MEIIKAERATVQFCPNVEVEGYRLPSGEFRVGKASIAKTLGYNKNWTGKLLKKAQTLVTSLPAKEDSNPSNLVLKQPQTLVTSLLFEMDGTVEKVEADGIVAETLSLKDFRLFIRYADRQGNNFATAILDAIIDTGLEDWFRLSFGEEQMSLEEKRDRFYKSYAASINWLEQDKQDIECLILPGDPVEIKNWNHSLVFA